MTDELWWQSGVVYQVYPRSFADGNGDGLGDLAGIIGHLDYLAELGVGAIWLSPVQPSPDADFGYDVSDYCAIDPRFGTLEEFDRLVARAHALGLRVILDMVMNHTSDEHPWFREARESRESAKRDWYVETSLRLPPNGGEKDQSGPACEFPQEQPPSSFPHLQGRKWGKGQEGSVPELRKQKWGKRPTSGFIQEQPPSGFPHLQGRKWGKGQEGSVPELRKQKWGKRPPSGFIQEQPPSGFPHFLRKWGKRKMGKAPNNWQASFGGKAWEFDERTGEYFLHLFSKCQPDVNWRNPELRQAQMQAFRFWLERGVDGFRLDVFNAWFKDERLRDNPLKFGLRGFDRQRHVYDMDQPEMIRVLGELRRLLDSYPQRYAVGEPYLPTLEKALSYCGADRLHAAFSFDFTSSELFFPWSAGWIRRQVQRREAKCQAAGVWPTTVLSNHDLPRAASRYASGENDAQAKIAMALLLTLRGTPFIYYGEEIGMRDIRLRRNEILDPPGKKYWPVYKGRDGCRAPMQWDASEYAGFSQARPWLPLHPDHAARNVAVQAAQADSLLNFTKQLLRLRQEYAALRSGKWSAVTSSHAVLAYLRSTPEQTMLVAINFKGRKAKFTPPEGKWEMVLSSTAETGQDHRLGPNEVRILKLGKDQHKEKKE